MRMVFLFIHLNKALTSTLSCHKKIERLGLSSANAIESKKHHKTATAATYLYLTSLVGAITKEEGCPTPTPPELLMHSASMTFCNRGSPNMMVFPLPVALLAMTSYRCSSNGMA
jgi:hypothetical protein